MKIYIGADHAGFLMKEKIKENLMNRNYELVDLFPSFKSGDDYPKIAFKLGEEVSKDRGSLGILICGTGAGMCISANKVKGIRASIIYDKYSAEMSKEHNHSNIACLRGRKSKLKDNLKWVEIWLKSREDKNERHKRRIAQIGNYER